MSNETDYPDGIEVVCIDVATGNELHAHHSRRQVPRLRESLQERHLAADHQAAPGMSTDERALAEAWAAWSAKAEPDSLVAQFPEVSRLIYMAGATWMRAHEAAGRAIPMVDDLCAYCGQRRSDWTHDAREAPSGLVHEFLERRPTSTRPETIEKGL